MSRQPRVKSRSEERREREVLQYVAAYQHLPRLEELDAGPELSHLPLDHKAQRSTDSTLTALCQLAALRMNAQRALVSLIDGQRQYVLAEATPRTPLRSSSGVKADGKNDLWLGSVSIPRSWGVCEQVLGLALDGANAPVGAGSSVIINEDLLQSSPHAQRTYVRDGPRVRFYAGAALIGINGGIVGALCVFGDQPRPGGVPAEDVIYLEDLATTVTEYLGTYTVKDRFRRGEKLTRGLISFAEGASGLLPLDQNKQSDHVLYSPVATTSSSVGSTTLPASLPDAQAQTDLVRSVGTVDVTSATSQVPASSSLQDLAWQEKEHIPTKSDTTRASATRNTSLRALQDTILPANSRDMFKLGSWKRTVMNLFGNALKYTHSGHIIISLHAAHSPKPTGSASTITLTVTDTGAGMSPSFLANKAFQPFSQENTHSSGVGLGLSIVRQIIETKGGKIEVKSDPSGTRMTIKLSLTKPEKNPPTLTRRIDYQSWLPRLQGRKICILHRPVTDQDNLDEPQNSQGLAKFTHALTTTLANHLKMDVVQTTKWLGNDTDLVICPEPSFDYLASIRDKRIALDAAKAPVTIFVALDALEAATLRSDVRVQNKESVVEIITQPLGPFKLAYVLNKCLDRFQDRDENVLRSGSTPHVEFPRPLSSSPTQSMSYSPAPADMPPLLDQPYWQQTEKSVAPAASNPLGISMSALRSPNAERHVLPIHSESTIPNAAINKTTTILITDDNVVNRRLLVAYMKKNNLDYVEAENGLEALRTYQSASVQFDAILMDMSMPVMDGVAATRAIRQYEKEYKIPRCYIMALTGLASASAKLEAWNAGIDHFMTKPINFKALTASLSKAKAKRDGNENTTEAPATTPAPTSSES
ncbi:hypothetical protein E8E13_010734 [Curvularia kusanoi]|uniref:Uncharacterized protein n=1 Tax=Curvularia kusanoi TaxID=90978 RepID=A0A9P4WE79_CURKU|nr:hypothetical protein E8E13_010734 [Curvularia kusanoi]